MNTDSLTSRRNFMGSLAAGATAGLTLINPLLTTAGANPSGPEDADNWFKKVKGKHKIVYDAPEPHDGFPIIWSWVFYKTNNATNTPDNELTAMIVFRHNAIPITMNDGLWEKYKFGEVFKVTDPNTGAAAVKNPFWEPTIPFWKSNGIQGMKELQARGAMFCVCDMALTVYSGMVAQGAGKTADEVKKDWVAGLHPGIQIVPSGVWAIGRAQEKGCAYCFAG